MKIELNKTYEFDLSAVPGSHPFQFSTSPNGTLGGGSIYEDVSRTDNKILKSIRSKSIEFLFNFKPLKSSLMSFGLGSK